MMKKNSLNFEIYKSQMLSIKPAEGTTERIMQQVRKQETQSNAFCNGESQSGLANKQKYENENSIGNFSWKLDEKQSNRRKEYPRHAVRLAKITTCLLVFCILVFAGANTDQQGDINSRAFAHSYRFSQTCLKMDDTASYCLYGNQIDFRINTRIRLPWLDDSANCTIKLDGNNTVGIYPAEKTLVTTSESKPLIANVSVSKHTAKIQLVTTRTLDSNELYTWFEKDDTIDVTWVGVLSLVDSLQDCQITVEQEGKTHTYLLDIEPCSSLQDAASELIKRRSGSYFIISLKEEG